MKKTFALLIIISTGFLFQDTLAQKIGKVATKVKATSSKKRSSSITLTPYVLPRFDFIQNTEPVADIRPINIGVAGGLLFRLWFNENWGVFTGAGIGKRQFQYTATGSSSWEGEEPGLYNWNADFRHEKLLAEVQAGLSWQYNFKKKPGSCARFGNRSTGWFFLADLGVLLAPEFRNEIFAKGNYQRYELGTEPSDLISTVEYPNWTQESEITENNETQVAILLRPAVKYQFRNWAIVAGPEVNIGLTPQKDLLNYRSNNAYKIHSLGLFVGAEF